MTQAVEMDVLIVGTGPTGATAALALASYGLNVQAISRYRWVSHTPRAHITNQRAMEVFRDLGLESDAKSLGSDWQLMGQTMIAESLVGREFGRTRAWGSGADRATEYLAASPSPMLDLIQPKLETLLVRSALERGAKVTFNTEYLGHQEDAEGVSVRLRDRINGHEWTVRARYLIGADGANSAVAENAQLPFVGEMGRGQTVYAEFTADLAHLTAHRPSILYWIASARASFGELGMGLLRSVEPWNKWIAGWGHNPDKGDADLSEQNAISNIRALVGDPDLDVTLGKVSTWKVNASWATQYSTKRVFCGGDAMHRHPPSGGLGSNTSVQDAFNLAWKIAYVVKGFAGPDLLASYSEERAPVGEQIVRRANESRREFSDLNHAIRGETGSPEGAWDRLFGDESSSGDRDRFFEALALKDYEYNAHGIELNQRYASSAVINETTEEIWARDPQLFAQITTRPGAKIPHAWLSDARGNLFSTLDLSGKGKFVLITGISGKHWVDAVETIGFVGMESKTIGAENSIDIYGDWARLREIEESGALLVRPDGYIAWRSFSAAADPSQAVETLSAVIDRILHV